MKTRRRRGKERDFLASSLLILQINLSKSQKKRWGTWCDSAWGHAGVSRAEPTAVFQLHETGAAPSRVTITERPWVMPMEAGWRKEMENREAMSLCSLLSASFVLRGILNPRQLPRCLLVVNGLERFRVFQMDLCDAPRSGYSLKAPQICWCQKRTGHLVTVSDAGHWKSLWGGTSHSLDVWNVLFSLPDSEFLEDVSLSSLCLPYSPDPCGCMLISFPPLIKQKNPNYSCWLLACYVTFKFYFPQHFLLYGWKWWLCSHTRGDRSAHTTRGDTSLDNLRGYILPVFFRNDTCFQGWLCRCYNESSLAFVFFSETGFILVCLHSAPFSLRFMGRCESADHRGWCFRSWDRERFPGMHGAIPWC